MIIAVSSTGRSSSAATSSCQRGFTIVELLVVIAILSLLMALLLPALGKARGLARNMVCQSQIRQIGQALHAYVHDSNGEFPNFRSTGGSSVHVWREYLWPIAGEPEGYKRNDDIGVWFCPDQKRWYNWTDLASYGGNAHFGGWGSSGVRYASSYPYWNIADVDRASDTLAIVDCYVAVGGMHAANRFYGNLDLWMRFNHIAGNTNIFFLDSHVESYSSRGYDDSQVRDWFYYIP